MSFKDELKNEANNVVDAEKKIKRLEEQRAREPIPKVELEKMAEEMAENIRALLKQRVQDKIIQYDYSKIFKNKKVNFRYEVYRGWTYYPITAVSDSVGFYRDVLPYNMYFYQSDHDFAPTDLYAVPRHLEQLFNAVKRMLEKDDIIVTWAIENREYGKVNFEAYIKCDSEGRII